MLIKVTTSVSFFGLLIRIKYQKCGDFFNESKNYYADDLEDNYLEIFST